MASKNFTGYLRDPLGEYATFDKWTFTHITTTGETVAGCTSILNIGADGFYNINIEYGQVNIRTRDTINKNTINQGTYVINSDTLVSTLPALLNAEVPVSDPVILQMEAILEDSETAAEAAEQSAEEAAISAAALNDIRYSKLDNPLTHLFKKNKLVDTLVGDLTWTRASNATYVDMYGIVQTAAIDEPRQEKEGWLIEGASTNNCLDSEFQEAGTVWVDSVAPTVTINNSTAPDGTVTAVKVESSTSGSGIFQVNAHTSTTSTASVWLKGDTGAESVSFGFSDDRVIVTLSTEWQRFEYTGDGTGGLNFTLYSSGGAHTFYAWGAQSEALPFASSYMPTTDSAATRAADLVSGDSSGNIPKTNKGLSVITKFNYIGYVVNFWVFNAKKPDGTGVISYRGSSGGTAWNVGITELAANNVATRVSDSGGIGFSVEADSNYVTAYNSNGESETTEMSPTGESQDDGVGTFTVGKWNGGNQFMYGHLSDFRIYDFALNEAEFAFLAGE